MVMDRFTRVRRDLRNLRGPWLEKAEQSLHTAAAEALVQDIMREQAASYRLLCHSIWSLPADSKSRKALADEVRANLTEYRPNPERALKKFRELYPRLLEDVTDAVEVLRDRCYASDEDEDDDDDAVMAPSPPPAQRSKPKTVKAQKAVKPKKTAQANTAKAKAAKAKKAP